MEEVEVLHMDDGVQGRQMERLGIPTTWCQGNFAYSTGHPEIRAVLDEWSFDEHFTSAPRTLCDAFEESFIDMIVEVHRIADLSFEHKTAHVAEEHAERVEDEAQDRGPLDWPDDNPTAAQPATPFRERESEGFWEKEMLEQLPLPGTPKNMSGRVRKRG